MSKIIFPPIEWRDGTKHEQAAYQGWHDAKKGRDRYPALWKKLYGKKGAVIAEQYFDAYHEQN